MKWCFITTEENIVQRCPTMLPACRNSFTATVFNEAFPRQGFDKLAALSNIYKAGKFGSFFTRRAC